ncbi:protein of unknown function [Azospirillum baldaniorum]|uniref:Uncharacterized protein n=1 Tax=Azospirillum baldaniorum TaxID=1064539 RepID=A0A9P1JSQ6_9PROT|nr:protein of unknown function [Azospirillum baldaniorum]
MRKDPRTNSSGTYSWLSIRMVGGSAGRSLALDAEAAVDLPRPLNFDNHDMAAQALSRRHRDRTAIVRSFGPISFNNG